MWRVACEDANSELIEVVTVADVDEEDRVGPVLEFDAHGAHVRGTKASWGDQKLVYLKTYFFESWGN